ncbi:ADP-ribosylation factor-like protein 13B, partial [Podochytrium sp. JEL0797]
MAVKPHKGFGHKSRCRRVPETRAVVYDVGGSVKIRNIWQNYLAESHACIFVVDALDTNRLPEALEALHKVYSDCKMKGKPLVILANKLSDSDPLSVIQTLVTDLGLLRLVDDERHESQEPVLVRTPVVVNQSAVLVCPHVLVQAC